MCTTNSATIDIISDEGFEVETSKEIYHAKVVVSATGSFSNPNVPEFRGREKFQGIVIHSSEYESPNQFVGKRVAIVGEGNSGAQILAEVSKVAETIWITQNEPRFLPHIVEKLAGLMGREPMEVARLSTENAVLLFQLGQG